MIGQRLLTDHDRQSRSPIPGAMYTSSPVMRGHRTLPPPLDEDSVAPRATAPPVLDTMIDQTNMTRFLKSSPDGKLLWRLQQHRPPPPPVLASVVTDVDVEFSNSDGAEDLHQTRGGVKGSDPRRVSSLKMHRLQFQSSSIEGSAVPSSVAGLGDGERCRTVVLRLGRSQSEDDAPISMIPIDRSRTYPPIAVDASCQTKVSKCGGGNKLMRPHNFLARLGWKPPLGNRQTDKLEGESTRRSGDFDPASDYGDEETLTIHVTAEAIKPIGRREVGAAGRREIGETESVDCEKRRPPTKRKLFGALSKISEDSLDRIGREGLDTPSCRLSPRTNTACDVKG